MPEKPEKFGQYLLRNQIVTQEQLNEALQCQVIFGGRLGTNLVELGYLTLDDLARLLSRRSGFPVAQPEELEELPRDTLQSLPRTVIEKFKVIPMRIEAKTLHLAVCDPTDLKSMDEIAFSTGMRIKPFLVPELRMYFLLEKHYGIKREIRYIRLGRTLSRGKYAGAMVGGPVTGTPPSIVDASPALSTPRAEADTATIEELESKGFRPLRAGEELTDEGNQEPGAPERPALSVVPPLEPEAEPPLVVGEPVALPLLDDMHLEPIEETPLPAENVAHPPASSPQEAAELHAYLQTAVDREDVAGVALRLARSHFSVAALLIVNKGLVSGWKGAGGALDAQPIENLMLPAAADSIFKAPATRGTTFKGPVPAEGLNERLLAGLGRSLPTNALVIPIPVKNRVVNLLYADNGQKKVDPAAAAFLEMLARDVGAAYERIILAKKKPGA